MVYGPTNLQGLNTFLALQSAIPPNGGAPQPPPPGAMGGGPQPQGLDIGAAFRVGEQAASADGMKPQGFAAGGRVRGYADGGYVDDMSMYEDEDGLGSISPLLMALTQRQMMEGGMDAPLTGEDKGLALAQAGFAMAGGESPHALTNIGQGASYGLSQLQRIKQARALQRMRESQMAQQNALRQAALMDAARQKAAALTEAKRAAEEKAEIARANIEKDKQIAADRLADREAGRDAAAGVAQDRAERLAEQRYTVNDRLRREQWARTGIWNKITGDDEHGVTGPPEDSAPYAGPQISDPSLPLKDRNKWRGDAPKQTQAIRALDLSFGNIEKNAKSLLTHPGLEGAVGFRVGQEFIPGSDAASFKAKKEALLSQVFAQAIQAMRDASRTGGAVGNVSDKEGARFESMLGSLSAAQDEEQFKNTLNEIIAYTGHLRNSYHEAYVARYGDLEPPAGAESGGPASPPSIDELRAKYGRKPNG